MLLVNSEALIVLQVSDGKRKVFRHRISAPTATNGNSRDRLWLVRGHLYTVAVFLQILYLLLSWPAHSKNTLVHRFHRARTGHADEQVARD